MEPNHGIVPFRSPSERDEYNDVPVVAVKPKTGLIISNYKKPCKCSPPQQPGWFSKAFLNTPILTHGTLWRCSCLKVWELQLFWLSGNPCSPKWEESNTTAWQKAGGQR